MKIIGELKTKVENTKSPEEAKAILKNAGVELTDEEIDLIVGGKNILAATQTQKGKNKSLSLT